MPTPITNMLGVVPLWFMNTHLMSAPYFWVIIQFMVVVDGCLTYMLI
jgi:hypothetical protein